MQPMDNLIIILKSARFKLLLASPQSVGTRPMVMAVLSETLANAQWENNGRPWALNCRHGNGTVLASAYYIATILLSAS
jgi:hypothetical protein